ncbi:MAG: aspartate aminotransferase family protein [SAR202 cluster bacterium]|nr:aspartate aminotransferase family protein [SAR202 cluster bacterium]|tara:strand:- start:311 stop:1618 length:1308 start_codon:yes stop_codon:yes gene_type:complete
MNHKRSARLFDKAKELIAGGVSSQIRVNEPADTPLFFTHAKGSKMWDTDGNEYIDYIQGMGPNLFGHSPDFINEQVSQDMENGYVFAAQFEQELEVAEMVLEMIPMEDATVRFASSGTEIDQLLLRTMRGFTDRKKILKFEGHYHGWMDSVNWSVHPSIAEAGPEDSPVPVGESSGMDQATAEGLVICQWNDAKLLEKAFKKHGPEIAGVIMEPILANTNCILPNSEFLDAVQKLCKENGSLLAFDEVITGFRIAKGGAQEYLGVTPDLATYAKSMAGGFPIAMIAGRREIMDLIGDGTVYHGGSFNSNVMSISATYASLKHIQTQGDAFYAELNAKGLRLMEGLRDVAKSLESDLHVQGVGSVFAISFTTKQEINNWRDHARNCDDDKYQRFAYAMLQQGIRLSSNGRIHLCSAHSDDDIEKTIAAAAAVLPTL